MKIIDCLGLENPVSITTAAAFGKIGKITLEYGKPSFWSGYQKKNYSAADIISVQEVSSEQFRNGGKALAGAIIGGVLTGGIGLLAGAAFGGRKRKEALYLIEFNDGVKVMYEEKAKSVHKAMLPYLHKIERTI